MRAKFLKCERYQYVAEIFRIGFNVSEKLQNSTKVDEIIVNFREIP
jgi:hypothetical protein